MDWDPRSRKALEYARKQQNIDVTDTDTEALFCVE